MSPISNSLYTAPVDHAYVYRAVERIRNRGIPAQLCVLRDGEVVLRESIHCRANALFWIFSASKPFMAVLIYLLAERGKVQLDEPVARYWPEFGQHKKANITIRQVLQHRSGLVRGRGVGDALAMSEWDTFVHRIAQSRPALAPGDGPAYQTLSYGFILGEIVQKVTGRTVREVLSNEVLIPLSMKDTFLGLPNELWDRHVQVSGKGLYGRLAAWFVNRHAVRCSVNPSAGISATASDIAAFYQMLLNRGWAKGRQILKASSIEMARTPSCNGELDRCARKPIHWAAGFELGGPRSDPRFVPPMGVCSSTLTFGHNGSDCCIAWADPPRRLAFAYLTSRLTTNTEAVCHLAAVADDILSAYAP